MNEFNQRGECATPIPGAISRKRFLQAACGAMLGALALPGAAQPKWPTRAVRILVGTAPGGGVDLMARALAQPLSELLGQSVIVDNKAGGSSNAAAADIIGSAPDGYNVMFGPMTQQTVNPYLISGSPNAARDLIPVGLIGRSQLHLVTKKDLPVNNIADLIKLAKSKPGVLTYSTSGVGTSPHLLGELLQKQAGISLLHVPYKGSGPALQSILAGETDISFQTGVVYQHVRLGKLRMLAVASDRRPAALPEIPTMIEAGFPDIVFDAWIGIWVPAATPAPIVERWSKALADACGQPTLAKKFSDFNAEARFVDSTGFKRMLDAEARTMSALIKERNIQSD
jgi:tripartite-type tricarboxylate transporter receptor subunit TctC